MSTSDSSRRVRSDQHFHQHQQHHFNQHDKTLSKKPIDTKLLPSNLTNQQQCITSSTTTAPQISSQTTTAASTTINSHCIVDDLQRELDNEMKKRNHLDAEYAELQREMDNFMNNCEEAKKNPQSKYDELIAKQIYFNETLGKQVNESKEKLKNLSQSLKHMRACGKDCDIHVRDLLIDYNCITKSDLKKEIKRFQRMQIDLKSNLDRLQWRLDCESKVGEW